MEMAYLFIVMCGKYSVNCEFILDFTGEHLIFLLSFIDPCVK